MKLKNNLQNKILFHAKKLYHYNELLITQCNSWLPEDEGNINMEKRMMEKNKKKKI